MIWRVVLNKVAENIKGLVMVIDKDGEEHFPLFHSHGHTKRLTLPVTQLSHFELGQF